MKFYHRLWSRIFSSKIEDKAVDLHLIKQALEANIMKIIKDYF